jgi:hypothetical protein
MSDAPGARTFSDSTLGHVPVYLDVFRDLTSGDKEISATEVRALVDQLRSLIEAANGGLSFGDGRQSSRMGNFNGQTIQYKVVDTATVLEIPHGLGRKPVGYWAWPQKFTARSGGGVPLLIPCGSDGDVLWGGGDNNSESLPSDWDNRMVYFSAEGDAGWLPGYYTISLW